MDWKKLNWYPVSFIGGLSLSLYALVPFYLVYADSLGFITLPTRLFALTGMTFVAGLVRASQKRGHKLFLRRKKRQRDEGFTVIELLVVISIIGILSALIFPIVSIAREAAYFSRSKAELREVGVALEMYANDNGGNYPPDVNRNIPAGLEKYLSGRNWPFAPWPGSIFDWDAWAPSDLTYDPKQQVYQISIRFCPAGAPDQCQFPNESWARNFDYYSSVYYCVSGPCRAHSSQPIDHPGLCVNC